jgi:hypothetical protein
VALKTINQTYKYYRIMREGHIYNKVLYFTTKQKQRTSIISELLGTNLTHDTGNYQNVVHNNKQYNNIDSTSMIPNYQLHLISQAGGTN